MLILGIKAVKFQNLNVFRTMLQLLNAIQIAEKLEKPPVSDLFSDVYDVLPPNLEKQERLLRETIQKHQKDYPTDVPV